jgi:DNA-binding CsgD family transcriptional regulator
MEEREERLIIVVLAVVALLTAFDIGFDLYFGSSLRHILIEGVVILAALLGIGYAWRRTLVGYQDRLEASEAMGARWRADAERWRAETAQLLRGLSEAIDRQFEAWALSGSEKEVAFLLLKGLSLKEVAEVRSVAEKTIRKQSLAIYRKAGLTGRAELAAYFLEDLLLPAQPDAALSAARAG